MNAKPGPYDRHPRPPIGPSTTIEENAAVIPGRKIDNAASGINNFLEHLRLLTLCR